MNVYLNATGRSRWRSGGPGWRSPGRRRAPARPRHRPALGGGSVAAVCTLYGDEYLLDEIGGPIR